MNCPFDPECEFYNNKQGSNECLKCKLYKDYQMASVKRKQVKELLTPQEILNQLPDKGREDLQAILLILPPYLASVVLLYCYADLSQEEVAKELKIKQATVSRRIKKAAIMMRKHLASSGK
jgi:RNA polymerase sigma factor (sigma-70 family)